METRFRRFLTLRGLHSEPRQKSHLLNDLDAHSIPYEPTSPTSASPVLLSEPLRKSGARNSRNDYDGLDIRSFSYDSVQAGKPPILGGRPLKGNGPIKLQTSRRLSSGELLATTQDPRRTLEDILDGDYIVGRKEKRNSQTSQIKASSPLFNSPASPPTFAPSPVSQLRAPSAPDQAQLGASPLSPVHHNDHFSPLAITHTKIGDVSPELPSPDYPPQAYPNDDGSPHLNRSSLLDEGPSPRLTRPRVSSNPSSLLTRGEEQNATIQALWRAEYARLVAIYGQDGVDRNIAELNRDRQGSLVLDRDDGLVYTTMPFLQPLPKPSLDGGRMSSQRNSRSSEARESNIFDDSSDHSGLKALSIMSHEESSSSHTKRTSIFDQDLPTTREDVRRIVEDMRVTYLTAIENKAAEKERTRASRKMRMRAPFADAVQGGRTSPAVKASKPSHQCWDGSNASNVGKPRKARSKKERKARKGTSAIMNKPPSKSNLKSTTLHRADSLTLGVLVNPTSTTQNPAPESTSLARQIPPPVSSNVAGQSVGNTEQSEPDHQALDSGPDFDDFEIFYQELGFTDMSSSIPDLAAPAAPFGLEAAPPPPDILSTPRKLVLRTARLEG